MIRINLDALLLGVILGDLVAVVIGHSLNIVTVEGIIVTQGIILLFGVWWYIQKLSEKEEK